MGILNFCTRMVRIGCSLSAGMLNWETHLWWGEKLRDFTVVRGIS